MATCTITGEQFTNFLITQLPYYDSDILQTIRPTDGEIGHFDTGTWQSFTSTQHTKDRIEVVFPDLTKKWETPSAESCSGTPCDPPTHELGAGNTRVTYAREKISWRTQLYCFDQVTDETKAVESIAGIIENTMRPSTNWVVSDFAKRKAATLAGKKWLADDNLTDFTFTWDTTGDSEQYITTTGTPVYKLTPQMLRRRFNPLVGVGYFGKMIDKDRPNWIELVTDNDTLWDMNEGDSAVLRSNGDLASTQWRFEEFTNVGQFWKYGWSGKVGNYAVRVDQFPLRFNRVSANRFQRVLPYRNVAATNGLKSEYNPDYDRAQYQFSRIHHRMGMRILTKTLQTVNGMMPFLNRGLGGDWRFAMNNLGAGCDGVPISNYRGNKGFFYADFDLAAEPLYTEWMELIFHIRTSTCIVPVYPCAPDPGYPTQNYNSANTPCPPSGNVQYISPTASLSGDYNLLANTVTSNGVPIVHTAVTGSDTLAALVIELNNNNYLKTLGVWSTDNTQLILTGGSGASLYFPWVTT